MWTWARAVMNVAVAVIPGGLLLLLGVGLGRTLWAGWRQANAQAEGRPVPLRQVLRGVTVRGVVREAFSA